MDQNQYMKVWKKSCIRIGTPTNILAAATAFFPVVYLCIRYNCWPNVDTVLAAWGLTVIAFGAFYVVEPISYYASLGMSGTYLGFLSGNIGNMRVPCAALALDVTESETGSIQAEVVSTMAICGSIITNLIASAAIFGATFGNFAIKKPKVAVFGLLIPAICKLIGVIPAWMIIVLSVFGTVLIARLFYSKEKTAA